MPEPPIIGTELAGQAIGGCRIERLLGKGGMGAVYLGRQLDLDRPVAIKVLAPQLAASEEYVQRFLREARTAARLEHPNVVSVYGAGEDGGQHYIVMQYVEGHSLAALLKKRGRLKPKEALGVLRETAKGLQAAHALGLVHRDIKPDNILIDKQGRIRVADFGLARDMGGDSGLTQTGQIMGTPHYMAPEQIDGGAVDARTDLYALGATFYQCLVGAPPFSGHTAVDILIKQRQEQPVPPQERHADIPSAVSRLALRLMAKAPSERPADAAALLQDIQRAARDEGPTVSPSGRMPELSAAEREQETIVAASLCVRKGTHPAVAAIATAGAPARPRWQKIAAVIGAAVLLLLAAKGLRRKQAAPPPPTPPPNTETAQDQPPMKPPVKPPTIDLPLTPTKPDRSAEAEKWLASAEQYEKAHPDDIDGAIGQYRLVLKTDFKDTPAQARAQARMRDLEEKLAEQQQAEKAQVDKVMEQTELGAGLRALHEHLQGLLRRHRYDEARTEVRNLTLFPRLRRRFGDDQRRQVLQDIDQGEQAFDARLKALQTLGEAGRLDEARAGLEQLVGEAGDPAPPKIQLAQAWLARKVEQAKAEQTPPEPTARPQDAQPKKSSAEAIAGLHGKLTERKKNQVRVVYNLRDEVQILDFQPHPLLKGQFDWDKGRWEARGLGGRIHSLQFEGRMMIQAEAQRLTDGNALGLGLSVCDDGEGQRYLASFVTDGNQFGAVEIKCHRGDQEHELFKNEHFPSRLRSGVFAFAREGDRLRFTVNDTLIQEVTDNHLARGAVGLWVVSWGGIETHLKFENIQVAGALPK